MTLRVRYTKEFVEKYKELTRGQQQMVEDAIVEAVRRGKVYRDEIIEHCLAQGLPKSTIYRRLGSEVKRWSTLAMVRVEREDREVAYQRWREELDEAFSKPSSPAFTYKLLETEHKSFLVEVTAKEYSENCRAKVKIIPYGLRVEPSEEFEVYWYPGNATVFNLNPGESVKTQLLRLALPEDQLKHIEYLQRVYRSAPDSEDVKYHINLRLMQAYESLENSVEVHHRYTRASIGIQARLTGECDHITGIFEEPLQLEPIPLHQ